MADYIDDVLGRALVDLRIMALMIGDGGDNGNIETRIEDVKAIYSRLSINTHAIYLINENGQITWSEPEITGMSSVDISFYPCINEVLQGGGANISGLVLAPVTNVPVILLVSPVRLEGEQGSYGVLIVAVDLIRSSIGGFVQPIRLGQTGYVEIVDQNGIVVARTEPGPKLAPFEKSDHSGRFAALIAAGKPTRGLCHTCHETIQRVERKDVLAFVPLSMASWGVIIRQSEEEALAPIRELRQNLLLYGMGLAIVTMFFVTVTTQDVVNRLRMLTAASQRIADGDMDSPITISQKDEVGILAQTFEDMRTKLRVSYRELEERTTEFYSLLSVSEILSRLPDLSNLDAALGIALKKTLQIMKMDTGGILLMDEEKQTLRYRVHHSLPKEKLKDIYCRLGEGITGKVAQTGEVILTENVAVDTRTTETDVLGGDGLRAFASVPLSSKEKVLGVLNIGSHEAREFSPDNVKLLEGIARQMATAIENARLHQEVQRKEGIRGELLQDILSIQEEERKRIARELHDETSQVLSSLTASLEAASGMLPASADKSKGILKKAQGLSISILDGINKLIYELRPSLLDDLGLVAATRWLMENNLNTAGVKTEFNIMGRKKRLAPRLETTLFRVIQEAVYNITRHAHARNATITLHFTKKTIKVYIKDDGKGFDLNEAISSKERPRGLGLLGMKERVELVNGHLEIKPHSGGGTEINIEIPLNQEVDDGQNKDIAS